MNSNTLTRRPLLLGAGAGAASLLLPNQAQAFVWAKVGRYVGGLALEWAVTKTLDYFWDEVVNKRSAILPHISDDPDRVTFSPFAEKSDTHLRFGNRMAQGRPRDSKSFFDIRRDFFRALRETSVDPADVIQYWGAPTSSAMGRPLQDGGELSGQFFSMHKMRYVVVRTFGGHAQMLPIISDKWARLARQIVNQEVDIEEAKKIPPLLTLIESPNDFVFHESWKPGLPLDFSSLRRTRAARPGEGRFPGRAARVSLAEALVKHRRIAPLVQVGTHHELPVDAEDHPEGEAFELRGTCQRL